MSLPAYEGPSISEHDQRQTRTGSGAHPRKLKCAALAALTLALGVAGTADAGPLYRYVDKDGSVHFTNQPVDTRFERVYATRRGLQTTAPSRPRPGVSKRRAYDHMISRAARAYSLEPALVKAVIRAESNFNPRAVSRVGAQGLMQLMPSTARSLGVSDPLEPMDNMLGGARYLRRMIDRYGDVSHALAAYNAGPTAVDRYQGIPPYRETQTYVTRVLSFYDGYHGDFRR